MSLAALIWPRHRLGEALEELAQRGGLQPRTGIVIPQPEALALETTPAIDRWTRWAGERLGIEVEPVSFSPSALQQIARSAAPALFFVVTDEVNGFILLLGSSWRGLKVLAPDLSVQHVSLEAFRQLVLSRFEAPIKADVERLVVVAGETEAARDRIRAALVAQRLTHEQINGCWLLRLPGSTGFLRQFREAALVWRTVAMMALFALAYALELWSWSVIGSAALDGRFDLGWLVAWILIVITMVPLRLMGTWFDATLALDLGRILKTRLLHGALQMDIETVRQQGAGQLLGRVMEAQALESLAFNGGFSLLIGMLEVCFAGWILLNGSGGLLHLALLMVWLAITVVLCLRFYERLRDWLLLRLDMTHRLIEQMVGHRTRLAQDWPDRRAAQDDRIVKDYLTSSRAMDSASVPIATVVAGGWTVIGLAGLAPGFVMGSSTPAALAIALGGILIANRALSGIASGLSAAARAWIAWRQVATIYHSGHQEEETTSSRLIEPPSQEADDKAMGKLIDADGLTFSYANREAPVLRGLTLTIRHGERILLEGPSGGGKSTLASLLVGLRKPQSGLLLVNGLDRASLGKDWHRFATEAPQFHENHILTGSLGFNLLMGRNWPASKEEMQEAEALCVDLGLGDLLQRMPAGLLQMVGETGWQLSHGERSRIFLARALLQKAELTVLDESFAALDPETLRLCLSTSFRHAKTLMVIAHP